MARGTKKVNTWHLSGQKLGVYFVCFSNSDRKLVNKSELKGERQPIIGINCEDLCMYWCKEWAV